MKVNSSQEIRTKQNSKKREKLPLISLIPGQHFELPLPLETLTSQNLQRTPLVVNTQQDQVLANTLTSSTKEWFFREQTVERQKWSI